MCVFLGTLTTFISRIATFNFDSINFFFLYIFTIYIIRVLSSFLSQLLHYLNAVNFTTLVGELVYLEDNGEPSASYNIMNWHVDESRAVNFIQV